MRQRLETRLVSTCFALYTECVCAFTWDVYKTATKYTCHPHTLAIMPAHACCRECLSLLPHQSTTLCGCIEELTNTPEHKPTQPLCYHCWATAARANRWVFAMRKLQVLLAVWTWALAATHCGLTEMGGGVLLKYPTFRRVVKNGVGTWSSRALLDEHPYYVLLFVIPKHDKCCCLTHYTLTSMLSLTEMRRYKH